MLTAAIYARYSSAHQKPSSIDDQVALCRSAAPTLGCTILDDHVYTDKEISGALRERPGYTRLCEAARQGAFQAIIVEASDRLWRDQAEMHQALKRLRFAGVKVFTVSTGTDLTDKTGKLIASVVGWKDEVYLDDLKDKIRRGMEGRVRGGFSVGGRAYGYRSEPVHDPAKTDPYGNALVIGYRRVVDPAEAEMVRRIFHYYAGGMSPRAIAYLLNGEHVPPPRTGRGHTLKGWTWQTIAGTQAKALGVLRNPIYIGRLTWNRTQKLRDPDTGGRVIRLRPQAEWISVDVPELRIMSDELWDSVQTRSERQKTWLGNKTGRHPKYILSGLLKCECGANFIVQKRRDAQTYYGCGAHFDRGPESCANGRLVPRARIERIVLDAIFNEVFAPETLAYLNTKVNEAIAELSAPASALRRKQQAQLAAARRELENIQAAIRQGIVTRTTKAMLEAQEQRVDELEALLRGPIQRRKVVYLPGVVESYLRDLKGSLETDPDAARRLMARLIGPIKLVRQGRRVLAEVRGNLLGVLGNEGDWLETVVPEEGLEPPRA